jgi:small subunit ribosomal protein S3
LESFLGLENQLKMGQKVNPILFRLGLSRKWNDLSFFNNQYGNNLLQDIKIKQFIENIRYPYKIIIDRIRIKRHPWSSRLLINLKTLQSPKRLPLEEMKSQLQLITGYKYIYLNITKAPHYEFIPLYNASLIAKYIAFLIEKRKQYSRILDLIIARNKKEGIKIYGYKVRIAGRINGVAKARKQVFNKGSLPLQNTQLNIDYGICTAKTRYGNIGVKVWIFYKKGSLKEIKEQIKVTEGFFKRYKKDFEKRYTEK